MESNIQEIIDKVQGHVYTIDTILESEERYTKLREEIYDYLKQGFEIEELRKCPVKFRFNSFAQSKIHTMQLRHFYCQLCMWYSFMYFGKVDLDDSYIIDFSDFTAKRRKKFIDEKIIIPNQDTIDNTILNIAIHDTIHLLARIANDFNPILGLTINTESFIDLYNNNATYRDLVHTKVDPNEQPAIVEKLIDDKLKILVDLLKKEENSLKPVLNAGNAIKNKQLAEFMINMGYQPDIDGNTIPIPINGNLTVGGLGNVTNYYLQTNASRKALLANKYDMGNSGYFSKMLTQLCSNIFIDNEVPIYNGVQQCRSIRPIEVNIKSEKHLSYYVGRYYSTMYGNTLYQIHPDDTFLIGKTIKLKSPITCSCNGDDHHICPTCYGRLSKVNKEICIGALAAALATEPVSQGVLSTKHLSVTDSRVLSFNEGLNEYMYLSSNTIIIDTDIDCDLSKLTLRIMADDINKINEFDTTDFNISVSKFYVIDASKKVITETEMVEKNGTEMYISPELYDAIKKKYKKNINNVEYYDVKFSDIGTTESDDSDSEIIRTFIMQIANNELTKPLHDIMGLLQFKKGRLSENIDVINQQLIDCIVQAGINVPAVFIELLLTPLMRRRSDILKVPKWSSYAGAEDYEVLTVPTALEKNPSLLIGLSSRSVGRQMTDIRTYDKVETSFVDDLFRE